MTTTATERKIYNSLEADDFAFFLSMNGYFHHLGEHYIAKHGDFTTFENRVRKLVAKLDAWKNADEVDTPKFYSLANFRWIFLKTGTHEAYRITAAALVREPDRAFSKPEIVYIDTEDDMGVEELLGLRKGTLKAAGAWDEGVLTPRDIRAWQKMVNETLEDFMDSMVE